MRENVLFKKTINSPSFSELCPLTIQFHSSLLVINLINCYNLVKPVTAGELLLMSYHLRDKYGMIGDFNTHSLLWDKRDRSKFSGSSIESY